ncbi:COP9 signalosome complex subunit 8 [Trichoplax sp. H2]|nr:COP9 signalosome complex subunit 8 [Trichoplax sp. H2]|eukprot:RDD41033.1 COP9 signalosome complex subunit 8 [Trichoplax sp. H2]
MMDTFNQMALEYEELELQAENGIIDADIYAKLLAIYLLQNDLISAKFLWKRIPEDTLKECKEIRAVWEIGKSMWQRNYPQMYASFDYGWSDSIKPIIIALKANCRNRAFQLVSRAYDSISWKDLAAIVGLSVEDAIQGEFNSRGMLSTATEKSWTVDVDSQMIMPTKIVDDTQIKNITNEQLKKLTDYVTYLEN